MIISNIHMWHFEDPTLFLSYKCLAKQIFLMYAFKLIFIDTFRVSPNTPLAPTN